MLRRRRTPALPLRIPCARPGTGRNEAGAAQLVVGHGYRNPGFDCLTALRSRSAVPIGLPTWV